ncbi:MAG: arylsulfatase [Kordiimonadaceae bacterium]|nr:arylsulfatase [Kordiimonadaceae bacterium]MBT6035283.1 arylsulfatase [Kordiimonadaceae bacterium]MBT6328837.1 arylsulfatase [Kordiimonadaceae bacterium]
MNNLNLFVKISGLTLLTFILMSCDQNGLSSSTSEEQLAKRPNILLILADDLGYSDIGAFGSEISTPNLDALAMGGVRMSNFYAAATCSPTRTMLLSGVDSHRAGMGTMEGQQKSNQLGKPGYEGYMNQSVVSVARLLQDIGYHTYMSGKWHLGYEDDQSPKARGFEKSFALLGGGGSHFEVKLRTSRMDNASYRENDQLVDLPDNFYSSEFYADKMIEYLKSDEGDEQPFFGYLTFTAPHWPLQAPDDYIEKYHGRYDDGYNVLKENRLKKMQQLGLVRSGIKTLPSTEPDTLDWNGLSADVKKIRSREMEVYAAMIDNMDHQIGRILEYLDKSGRRENTLIVFMSDNGAQRGSVGNNPRFAQSWIDANFDNSLENMGRKGSYVYYDTHWTEASTGISRLMKGFPSEGGIKVPGIINFPGKLEELNGGISDQFMTVLDLAPTFLELAGTKHPGTTYKGREIFSQIGTSAAPFMNGTSTTIHGVDDTVIWELHNQIGLRSGDWKMLKIQKPNGTGDWELFNLADDPGETNDIQSAHPEQLQKMIKAWDDYVIENGVVLGE